MGPRVLVADSDPWILRMVVSALRERGFDVVDAPDGAAALALAEQQPPDLVLSEILMSNLDGCSLFNAMQERDALKDVPFIFVSALGRDPTKLAQLGIDPAWVVSKPFRFDHLIERVNTVLGPTRVPVSVASTVPSAPTRTPHPTVPPAPTEMPTGAGVPAFAQSGISANKPAPAEVASLPTRPAMVSPDGTAGRKNPTRRYGLNAGPRRPSAIVGRLEQLQLSSLLVMMEMERKDGCLLLAHEESGQSARLYLREGQVVQAHFDEGNQDIAGRDVVYEILKWQTGSFRFNPMSVTMDDEVNSTVTHLLMEGARLIDEARS